MKIKFNTRSYVYQKGTAGWWFNQVPDLEIRMSLFKNTPMETANFAKFSSFQAALYGCFSWSSSPQGYIYWSKILHKYDNKI